MLIGICVFFILIYSILVFNVGLSLKPTNNILNLTSKQFQHFSIIIPFRNEIKNLPNLIKHLNALKYPIENFEVIFVNDHSTDRSIEFLTNHLQLNYRIISLNQSITGKKAAIKWGAQQAQFNWLIFLDADCSFDEQHLIKINRIINNKCPEVLYGSVLLNDPSNLITRFDYLENLLLQGFTAFGFLKKIPFLANGANWAVKKECFIEHRYNPDEGPSGDDVFFLHHAKTKLKITYDPSLKVYTSGTDNFWEFINQKIRRAYKWKIYFDKTILSMGLVFLAGQSAFLLILPMLFFNEKFSTLACLAIGIKLFSEIFLGKKCSQFFNQKAVFTQLLIFCLTYPIFTMLMAPISALAKYSWKDRTYN